MGRRKRKALPDDEERWRNATTVPIVGDLSFQVVGHHSPTGTLFVRHNKADTTRLQSEEQPSLPGLPSIRKLPSLCFVLERVFDAVINPTEQLTSSNIAATKAAIRELCRLGAIWISSRDPMHPQNLPKWNRATESQLQQQPLLDDDTTVRIHSRPPRFPSFAKLQIVFKNNAHGFWVVNKSGGCPSHATVDNGIENVLAVVQQQTSYATLPQRLDTETSGLLLVATRRDFARYMGQLLESKTKNSKLRQSTTEEPFLELSKCIKPLTKKYRCLVVIADNNNNNNLELYHQLCRWKDSRYCVTHYVDAASSAPKRFMSSVPDDEVSATNRKWQLCQLHIASVSQPYPVSVHAISGSSNNGVTAAGRLYSGLFGEHQIPTLDDRRPKYVLELEIDLLTGRTHQIRGQLSALGAPIVGDVLYGGTMDKSKHVLGNDSTRARHRMALQCCSLEFQKPKVENSNDATTEVGATLDDSSFYKFYLDHAWWTEYLQQYGDEGT